MTTTLGRRENGNLWDRFCQWITSTDNRLYICWFGVLSIGHQYNGVQPQRVQL
ncbi:hypothetical protein [Nostoc sp.]|uniref:hypothetical protein n=1 Tax=Nostoc sp. TaxID=1180 RepID=UPI003FA5F357